MVKIEEDIKLDFSDVLIKPKRTTLKSRSDVILERNFKMKHSKREWIGVPIAVSNMDSTGTFEMFEQSSKHNILTCIHKHYTLEEWVKWSIKKRSENNDNKIWNCISVSTGISEDDFFKTQKIFEICPEINILCIDVANGYAENFVQQVQSFRSEFPDKIIIAGNVVSSEMTEQLILSGADIIKVGIGPGSVCTTRKQTGVGFPQLSAILECADAAHGLNGLIMADGGCVCPGDIAKAFGAGADFVMSGGMFSGHDECSGDIIERDGKKFKQFYGMSSDTAMKKYKGGVANYRSSEGKTVEILCKGSVNNTIIDILGGVRSTCTYVGARYLKELSKRTTFVRVNRQLNNIYS